MLTTRFPCLLNPPKRTLSQLSPSQRPVWSLSQRNVYSSVKPPNSKVQRTPTTKLASTSKKITLQKKAVPLKLLTTPLILPQWPQMDPDDWELEYEERTIGDRLPISFRMYHPRVASHPQTKIFYIPSPTSDFLALERVVPFLSRITSATIIVPLPSDTVIPFPQSLHNLLKIFDKCDSASNPIAILSAGISATLAAAIAMTEPSVRALGIWGGILDLTAHAEEAAAWNREHDKWDHFTPPFPSSTRSVTRNEGRLGMTEEEFWKLRALHFPNPETWADPFASPQLFCRSAHLEFSRLTLKDIWGEGVWIELRKNQASLGQDRDHQGRKSDSDDEGSYIYPRRQSRLFQDFPPLDRKTDFPWINLILPSTTEEHDDVTLAQGIEFESVARTAVAESLIKKNRRTWRKLKNLYKDGEEKDEEAVDAVVTASKRILTDRLLEGEAWEGAVWRMGHWLNWVFNETPGNLDTRQKT